MSEVIFFLISDAMATLDAAIIAVTGVFVTAYVSVRNLKRESYNKRVTEERIRWLNKMREDFGIIMAGWEMKKAGNNNSSNPKINKDFYDEKMYAAERAKAEFISRLNTSTYEGNEYNLVIKETLEKMCFIKGMNTNSLQDEIEIMKMYVNKMLEQEWHKSKEETR